MRSHQLSRDASALLEGLEPRRLLAAQFAGTDTDGDQYTIKLTGPGNLTVSTSGGGTAGFIQTLSYTGTTTASTIRISVKKAPAGDGAVVWVQGGGGDPLGRFEAPSVDLVDTSDVSFGVLGKLVLRDLRDDANVAIGGSASDTVQIVLRDLGVGNGDSGIQCGSRVSSFKARDVDSGFFFHAGVETFTATGSARLSCAVDGPLPAGEAFSIKSLSVGGDLNVLLNVIGDVGSIRAASFNTDTDVTIAGRLGTLTAASGDLNGLWIAQSFGAISAKLDITGSWTVTGADASGVSIGSIKADSVTDGFFELDAPLTAGAFKSVSVRVWNSGELHAGSFGTVTTKGDLNVELHALDTTVGQSIGKVKVGGTVSGVWEIVRGVGSVTAARTSSFNTWFLTAPGDTTATLADVGLLKFTDKAALNRLHVRVRTIGTVAIAGDAQFFARLAGSDAKGQSIASLSARVAFFDITTSFVGGINKLTIGGADGGGISTDWVRTFKVLPINGSSGSLNNYAMQIRTAIPGSTLFLGSIDVKNGMINSEIKSQGPIGSIAAGWLDHTELLSGSANLIGFLPSTVIGLDQGASIGSVLIRRAFSNDANLVAVKSSNIITRTIGKVTINGRIDPDNTGVRFGLGSQAFTGPIQIRDTFGQKLLVTPGATGADVLPIGGDFTVRHYA